MRDMVDLIFIFPCPVKYPSLIPALPRIFAPVGKSGPFIILASSSTEVSLSSMSFTVASITSPRLCGGIDVAIPTVIPFDPFTKSCGNLDGSTLGRFCRDFIRGR